MEKVQLSLSPAQMTKIRKGMPIQIKHGSMGNGDRIVSLHRANAKKMKKEKHIVKRTKTN